MKKDEILALLVAINGQYNLSKEMLGKIADMAPSDLTQDTVNAWVESQKPYMAAMQSYADSRVTAMSKELEELKKKTGTNSTPTTTPTAPASDWEKALGEMRKEFETKFASQQTIIDEQKKTIEGFNTRNKEAEFLEIKKRVASELKLPDTWLKMLESRLNVDMDEAKVNEVLSAGKLDLQALGLQTIETGSTLPNSATEAAKARAKAELDRLEEAQK